MNVLDSPLEALAFNYLNFAFLTFVNNLWTWIALLTAALSFWRIRSAGCPKPQLLSPSNDRTSDPAPEVLTLVRARPVSVPAVVDFDVDGVTKGKFTVYYEDDSQCVSEELLTVTEEWEERELGRSNGGESEWWESWERLLRMRIGENENGWYTSQDLTALNGNVVRLWDGGLRFGSGTFTRGSRDSSSCIHVW